MNVSEFFYQYLVATPKPEKAETLAKMYIGTRTNRQIVTVHQLTRNGRHQMSSFGHQQKSCH